MPGARSCSTFRYTDDEHFTTNKIPLQMKKAKQKNMENKSSLSKCGSSLDDDIHCTLSELLNKRSKPFNFHPEKLLANYFFYLFCLKMFSQHSALISAHKTVCMQCPSNVFIIFD